MFFYFFFFFQAEDGIRDVAVTGVQTCALPIAALVASINARLDHALRVVAAPEGALPVVFTPAGLSALMLPVTQALSGKAVLQGISPLEAKVGEQVFDPRFSLTDDPLHGGRIA